MNIGSGPPVMDVKAYAAGILSADRAILACGITLIESSLPDHQRLAQELLVRLLPHAGGAHRLGITGVPGAGKSTFIDILGLGLPPPVVVLRSSQSILLPCDTEAASSATRHGWRAWQMIQPPTSGPPPHRLAWGSNAIDS